MSTTISDLISAAFKPEDLRENTVTLFFRGEILNPNRRISSYALRLSQQRPAENTECFLVMAVV